MKRLLYTGRGFSLLELMIVVGMIGILSAVATPFILNWIPASRLQSTARDLLADFQLARMTAIKNNADVTLTFNPVAAAADGSCAGGSYTFTDTLSGNDVANRVMANGLCIASGLDPNLSPPIVVPAPVPVDFAAGDSYTGRGIAQFVGPGVRCIAVTDNSLRSDAVYVITMTTAGGVTLNRF